MLTQNYINASLYFADGIDTVSSAFRNTNGDFSSDSRARKSDICKAWVNGFFTNGLPSFLNSHKSTIWIGNGTGDFNGYSLRNTVSTFTASGPSVSTTLVDGVSKRIAVLTFLWTGSDDTITEVGMVAGDNLDAFLMSYEELKTPIEVHNGDTFTVSMTLG